ncbi:LOW QUALITY PROTEIN: uncharacterized protein LOC127174462 [Labeo rohita]|uniref:LOW QUALITY PROTEIN: uncharacterized protein LOC127174462 n=1 Tax=Labeo rohita TaxID=84645 RepID=UPI0021E1CC7B|nr:LOW QUALITY PROTEIN: uncharacterized protein LOC127174462 [Labeo rohita]
MSNQEKRHRTSMQHLRYLDSFMDEIDREVMSLTDRAFKSLCIGDEAIYNDSEFSPSPVSCHKPTVEDVSKKTQESSLSAVKKLNSYPLNGANDPLSKSNKFVKDSSLFAVFATKKNGESTKKTNGESWDKSALLSIQRELSEFSSDYQSLKAEHRSHTKNHLKPDEKGSGKKSSKDASIPSGKSSKSKQSKNKLRKLNCINFFLHSEFSPFLSWRDFNKFSIGQEHISEIMLSNRPPEWYDSPLYKELTAAHGHYTLNVPPSAEKEVEKCPKQTETHPPKPQLASVQQKAAPKVPPRPEKESEHIQHNIPIKAPPLAAEQRCNSEKVEACVPWRKSRSRAKSAAPMEHSINLPTCEKTSAGEGSAQAFKEVKTIEDQTSTSSTPFSISQLLTPVIPSRHGTGTSEILQTVFSPTGLEVPALPERDLHPSPEIKREGYKSIASSLLFNLKDNRKRVKSMYSPPKFKGLDATNQIKESPQPEASKDVLEIPEASGAKTISPGRHKAIISTMSPLLETGDNQTGSPANDEMPDDFLALSLLQSGKLKSNRNPATKATYPSLQLYRKASPEEIRANAQTDTSSQVVTEKPGKDHDTKHNYPNKLLQNNDPLELMLNAKKPAEGLNIERTLEKKSGKSPSVSLTKPEEQAVSDSTNQGKDRLKTKETVSNQKSPVKEQEPNRKEAGTKHVFSARQNNYIKSQRFVSTDDDNGHDAGSSNAEKQLVDIKDKNDNDEWSRHSKNTKTKEIIQEEHNAGIHKNKAQVQTKVDGPLLKENVHVKEEAITAKEQSSITSKNGLETQREQKAKDLSMKGNTSAKRALFASMEPGTNKTLLKRENVVIDKYDLATMALEEVIAEREQRKLKNTTVSNAGGSLTDRKRAGGEKPQEGLELPTSGEDQLPSKLRLNERGTKDGKDQNTVSAFKTNWQTVQTKSDDMAKHGESHVPEVKLARPCKQEASNGQSQHVEPIKYNERDRLCLDHQESNTNNISKGDKICRMKELLNKNTKKCTKRGDHLESRDVCSVGQYEEELGVDKEGRSCKPEIPPRRGRSNSQSNVEEKTESNLGMKREGDTTVKTEIMESKEVSKVQSSQSKNRGPVRGNVSALKEKYDKESKVNRKDAQKGPPVEGTCSEERPNERAPKDKMKHKFVPPKLTVSDLESGTYSVIFKEMDSESSKESERGEEHSSSQRKRSVTQDFQNTLGDLTNNRNEKREDKVKTNETEEGALSLKELGDKQNKSKGPKVNMKDFLSGLLGLSNSERVKTVDEHEEELSETLSSESLKPDKVRKDSITVYDILGQSHSTSLLNGKQTHHSSRSSNSSELSLLHESEQGVQSEELLKKQKSAARKKVDEKVKENFQKPSIDFCSLSNHESESDVSDRVVSPPSDVDKRGWVHSLIESSRNLPQISLHQDQQENGLNRSEKDSEDLDLFKDHPQVEMPAISVKSPQPNQPAMQFLSLPTTCWKGVGSASVSEEEERRSAVSTLSEGIDGYETSGGDTMEENISSTAPTEDTEGSKAASERSASACSGNDSQGQNKPPVVPPKTEKALRRAMKLTTRRIQKAEAKSKSERKGRSGDKSVSHKTERRHHSTDKDRDRSEHGSLSSDRIGKQSDHLDDKLEHKTRSEKHARRHSGHKSQNVEENDPSKTVPHATKGKDRQTCDSKSHRSEKQPERISNHKDHLENGNVSNDSNRLGRSNEKYSPKKLERRTQSLDRFLRDKHENISSGTGKTALEVNSIEGSQYCNPKALPLRHNSIEHTFAPATNLVTQSFPITQRKLLQDPDSGQYFLVDMPVQVKTKTFFDPETKSYVQLPVQSPEAAVRQAPPLEVINTPSLMLYHGFVPVPVPSQKSVVRTAGSMIPPDDLEDFEPSRKQMQEDFYETHNEDPYTEPVYIPQEHTPEEEIDIVR